MSISRDDVLYIAKLARLKLSEDEINSYQSQLSEILGYIDKLNELDTSNIEPTFNINGKTNAFREDVVLDSYSDDLIFKNAPSVEDRHFKIPKVIE